MIIQHMPIFTLYSFTYITKHITMQFKIQTKKFLSNEKIGDLSSKYDCLEDKIYIFHFP